MWSGKATRLERYMRRKYGEAIPEWAWEIEAPDLPRILSKETEAQFRIRKGHILEFPDGSLGLPPKSPVNRDADWHYISQLVSRLCPKAREWDRWQIKRSHSNQNDG